DPRQRGLVDADKERTHAQDDDLVGAELLNNFNHFSRRLSGTFRKDEKAAGRIRSMPEAPPQGKSSIFRGTCR
ncbi:MAG: hypothetical protein IJT50_14475, partial [Lentisphaeria bacterium]|nr:hypothetical protein [Lentisphaeria bacterium]